MLGIGGGVILSPMLLILGWASLKETACISNLFIFVNSLAGLVGLFLETKRFQLRVFTWFRLQFLVEFSGHITEVDIFRIPF